MSWEIWLAIGLAVLLILALLIWSIAFINKVKILDNNVENSFAQIDVQLKRRNDLIPKIITETCEYCGIKNPMGSNRCKNCGGILKANDNELFSIADRLNAIVTQCLKVDTVNEKIKNAEELESAIAKFTGVAEQDAKFKKDEGFFWFKKELKEIETKIGHFRQFFNDSVLIYNRKISTFPNSVLAKIFKFKKKEYLATEPKKEIQE